MKFYLRSAIQAAVIMMLLCSCGVNGNSADVPSMSDSLRYVKKFEGVLLHYPGAADSLKRKAAIFLIDNMRDKFSYRGEQYDLFVKFIDSLTKTKLTSGEYKQAV